MLTSRLRSLPSAPIQSAAARAAATFTLVEFCHGGAGDEQDTRGGGARKRFRQQWPIFEFRVAQRNGPSRGKSQVLTSEQTDGNRDGTVPLVNPITTAPRLVASQAGLFHCPNFQIPSVRRSSE